MALRIRTTVYHPRRSCLLRIQQAGVLVRRSDRTSTRLGRTRISIRGRIRIGYLTDRKGATDILWSGWAERRSLRHAGGTLVLAGGFLSLHLSDHTSAVIESYYANQSNSSTISQSRNARWDGVATYLIHDLTKE